MINFQFSIKDNKYILASKPMLSMEANFMEKCLIINYHLILIQMEYKKYVN